MAIESECVSEDCPYVSRGGLKLAAAMEAFNLQAVDRCAADLGCNAGGFTDCLLQQGARKVFSVDTGYGALAWTLRQDDRVVVMERTNALHVEMSTVKNFEPCSLVVIDLGWTRQNKAIPAALPWLDATDASSRIITLIKPHYEADRPTLSRGRAKGILEDADARVVAQRVVDELPELGVRVQGFIESPIRGGKGKGKAGNIEFLACLSLA